MSHAAAAATGQTWPGVSIVFLAYNRRDELRASLGKVHRDLDYEPSPQVIVVDNASTDGTAAMVEQEFPGVQVVQNASNVGVSGWNHALPFVQGRYVLMLDDDCYLEGDSLARAVVAAERDRADLVSFRVTTPHRPNFEFEDQYPTGLLMFWGCAALVRRDVLQALGGYDPNIFVWANELDFTIRLLDHGFRHLTLPEVEAVHMKSPSDDEFELRPLRINHRNWGYIVAKLLRPTDAVVAMVNLTLRLLVQTRRWDRRALLVLPELARGFRAGLRVRKPVRRAVSSTYRRHCHSFAWPWPLLRSPRERLRGLGDPSAPARHRARRRERFFARGYYPPSTKLLEL